MIMQDQVISLEACWNDVAATVSSRVACQFLNVYKTRCRLNRINILLHLVCMWSIG